MSEPLTTMERDVLTRLITEMDSYDYAWLYARTFLPTQSVVGKKVYSEYRAALKNLRIKALVSIERGGVNEDGNVCGGSGYAPTSAGRIALGVR